MRGLISENIKNYTDKNVILLDEVDSTNNFIKQNAQKLKVDTCVIANSQTQGRGRINKKFFSPKNSGLYLSILIKPEKFLPAEITAAAAVAVARAIERFSDKKAQIKWVNDVLINNKKVCGILCEALFRDNKPEFVVVGIGVNLLKPQNDFDEEIKQIADAVFWDKSVNFDAFAANVINEFFLLINENKFLKEYKERSMLIGKNVVFSDFVSLLEGTVTKIDNNYAIVIATKDGEKAFNSGEITFIKY